MASKRQPILGGELQAEIANTCFACRRLMNGVNGLREKMRKMPPLVVGKCEWELRMVYGAAREILQHYKRVIVRWPSYGDRVDPGNLMNQLEAAIDGLERSSRIIDGTMAEKAGPAE